LQRVFRSPARPIPSRSKPLPTPDRD
jgi:hypothetical protein